ncbi:hypothetical protein H4O14_02340 [Bacillus sp. PAMC26568]|nr:hypothetical protein H4O14_02340 [Bacillus sp. PAMC26568]
MYKVIKKFHDKDRDEVYNKGDLYVHEDAERIAFLIEKNLLNDTEEPKGEFPKHTGGGWYELADGSKVQGKEEAIAAMNDIENRGE